MPGFSIKIIGLVAMLLGVGTAHAQEGQIPKPMPLPNPTELPKVPTAEPLPNPSPPVPVLLASPNTTLLTAPPGLPPLPGSVADQYAMELQAREQFRAPTWRGDSFDGLPNTLLWQPGFAVRRDPRLQFTYSNLGNYQSGNSIDTSVGGTQGLLRYNVGGADLSYQLDIFGVVLSRFSPNDLLATDFRFGLPLTWKRGWWSGKLAYERTSTHVGNEFYTEAGANPRKWYKDEIVLGLSRVFYDQFRLFGNLGYAFSQEIPNEMNPVTNPVDQTNTSSNRSRVDIGFDWFQSRTDRFPRHAVPGGRRRVSRRSELAAEPAWSGGVDVANPYMRMGTARVFIEYYTGKSSYGLLYQNKETYASLGFAFDY